MTRRASETDAIRAMVVLAALLAAPALARAEESSPPPPPPPAESPAPPAGAMRTVRETEEVRESEPVTRLKSSERARDARIPGHRFLLGAGVDLGLFNFLPSASLTETKRSSLYFGGRLAGTYFTPRWSLDAAVGWLSANVEYSDAVANYEVRTRTAFIELSPRYRVVPRLELGPSFFALLGTDAGFIHPTSPQGTVFLGGVAAWRIPMPGWTGRVSVRVAPDLTIADRLGVVTGIAFEAALPVAGGGWVERRDYETTRVVEKVIVREREAVTLDEKMIHFEFNRPELTAPSKIFVLELGKFLVANPDVWAQMRIAGHTDARGDPEYNRKLSQGRADAVKGALVEAGVLEARVEAVGLGESELVDPADNDMAHARNRRVELAFPDARDLEGIKRAIDQIKARTVVPETCVGGVCK